MIQRYVNTGIWLDGWIQGLSKDEKLFFLFLLTTPEANIAGIFEITKRTMEFCTGIDIKNIENILEKFEAEKKVFYCYEHIIMVNHLKNQKMNPNMKKAVHGILTNLDEKIKETDGYKLYSRTLKKYNNIVLP